MKKKTFYTLMERLENLHLVKDVGMIPYMLQKQGYFQSYIVGYDKDEREFKYLYTNVKGLNYVKRKRFTGNTIVDGIIWLMSNAKEIDVLNLYHYKPSTFIWIIVYKIFNRNGKIYLKLDIDASDGKKMKMKKGTIKYFLTKNVLSMSDVISAETMEFVDFAEKKWPITIKFIPNGIMNEEIDICEKKEKIILSVGRHGTHQKATEVLLNSFIKALPNISFDWKLVLIGSMERDFLGVYKELVIDNNLDNRIIYKGEITDRAELFRWYQRSMIFTLPSRYESFGIVALEALSKGDYLLLSDLISFREITKNERFGKLFEIDNENEYTNELIELCNDFDHGKKLYDYEELELFLKKVYCYESICEKLNTYLK